jgi:hypothetical protein
VNPSNSRAFCVLVLLLLAVPIRAQQSATATVSGRITDSRGDVGGGAQIVAANKATATTAGRVFDSGGPRAFRLAVRSTF